MENAWPALWLSLQVATWATLACLVLGTGVGYALARWRFPGRDLVDTLLTLPMVMPPTVLGYYLLVLLGRKGWVGGWLHDTFGIPDAPTGLAETRRRWKDESPQWIQVAVPACNTAATRVVRGVSIMPFSVA